MLKYSLHIQQFLLRICNSSHTNPISSSSLFGKSFKRKGNMYLTVSHARAPTVLASRLYVTFFESVVSLDIYLNNFSFLSWINGFKLSVKIFTIRILNRCQLNEANMPSLQKWPEHLDSALRSSHQTFSPGEGKASCTWGAWGARAR